MSKSVCTDMNVTKQTEGAKLNLKKNVSAGNSKGRLPKNENSKINKYIYIYI